MLAAVRSLAVLLVVSLSALPPLLACGGDDAQGQPDASEDATADITGDLDAGVDEPDADLGPEPVIWANSTTTLYRFDPLAHVLSKVADFDCNGEPMLDIAVNSKQELYGVTSETLVKIDEKTALCYPIAKGNYPPTLAFLPAGTLDPNEEALVGYKLAQYVRIDPQTGATSFVGSMNPNDAGGYYEISGDVVSIAGGDTYLTAVGFNPTNGDGLTVVDPATGKPTKFLGFAGKPGLLGLAQWAGVLYAFSAAGHVYRVKLPPDGGQPQVFLFDLDAGLPPDDASVPLDAAVDGDAAPEPFRPSFHGAAVTTRAPAH